MSMLTKSLEPKYLSEHTMSVAPDKMFSLRELSCLYRREFNIQKGQIGKQGSNISYINVCRQIDEEFSDAEIVSTASRVIKPGHFKDLLMNKNDLTVEELKGFWPFIVYNIVYTCCQLYGFVVTTLNCLSPLVAVGELKKVTTVDLPQIVKPQLPSTAHSQPLLSLT